MAPRSSDGFDTAFMLVMSGMKPELAWEQAGKPGKGKDSALSNIRKRARLERQKVAASPATPATPCDVADAGEEADSDDHVPAVLSAMPPPRKNGEKKSFRIRTDQVDKEAAAKRARTRVFVDALKEASAFYQKQQMTGSVSGSRALSAVAVADKFSRDFPPDVPKLKGMRIRDHVVAGLAEVALHQAGAPSPPSPSL